MKLLLPTLLLAASASAFPFTSLFSSPPKHTPHHNSTLPDYGYNSTIPYPTHPKVCGQEGPARYKGLCFVGKKCPRGHSLLEVKRGKGKVVCGSGWVFAKKEVCCTPDYW